MGRLWIAAAAVLSLALVPAASAGVIVQTLAMDQSGETTPGPLLFAPFESATGVLTSASLRAFGDFTPEVFDETSDAPPTTTFTMSLCLVLPILTSCGGDLGTEPAVLVGGNLYVGAPGGFDLTFDVTSFVAAFENDEPLAMMYGYDITDTAGGAQDLVAEFFGTAVLTYNYVPEPASLALFTTALVALGLMRRRKGKAG